MEKSFAVQIESATSASEPHSLQAKETLSQFNHSAIRHKNLPSLPKIQRKPVATSDLEKSEPGLNPGYLSTSRSEHLQRNSGGRHSRNLTHSIQSHWFRSSRRRRVIYIMVVLALLSLILGLGLGLGFSHAAPLQASGGPFKSSLTYYEPSVGTGACGWLNSDSDLVAAIQHSAFDKATVGGNPNTNPLCGKMIRVTYNGNSVDAKVVDRCPGCISAGDLDLSDGAFEKLADKSVGRIQASWVPLGDDWPVVVTGYLGNAR